MSTLNIADVVVVVIVISLNIYSVDHVPAGLLVYTYIYEYNAKLCYSSSEICTYSQSIQIAFIKQ